MVVEIVVTVLSWTSVTTPKVRKCEINFYYYCENLVRNEFVIMHLKLYYTSVHCFF